MRLSGNVSLLAATILLMSCGGEYEAVHKPGNLSTRSLDGNPTDIGGGSTNTEIAGSDESAVAAFGLYLHPILTKHCASCHASAQTPFFAVTNVDDSVKNLIESRKVNLDHPEESKIATRLSKETHQCWSDCGENANEILAGIIAWAKAANATGVADGSIKNVTGSMQYSAARTEDRPPQDPGTLIFEAESGTLTAPMVRTEAVANSGGAYIGTPERNQAALAANAPNAGRVVYQFEITRPGTYFVFAKVQGPTNNANAFNLRMDNGAFTVWDFAVTGNDWQWIRTATGNNQQQSFTLSAGAHSLEIRQREDGARLDLIAITDNAMFVDGSPNLNLKAQVLDYDISGLVGRKATFSIDVVDFDEYSFKFRNPKIQVESGTIEMTGLIVSINGKEVPEAATYSRVKSMISAPGGVISSAAMIVPKQNMDNSDEISFRFTEIK